MRRYLIGLTLLTLCSVILLERMRGTAAPPPPPPTAAQVRRLLSLVTLGVTVHERVDLVRAGYLGDLRVTWDGPGTVLLAPDLRQARLLDRNDRNRTVTFGLPRPRLISAAVDLQQGRFVVSAFGGAWRLLPDETLCLRLQESVLARAQRALAERVTPEQLRQAKRQTEQAAGRLGEAMGWTLRVQWRD